MRSDWLISCFRMTIQCVLSVKIVISQKNRLIHTMFYIMHVYHNTQIYTFTILTVIHSENDNPQNFKNVK